MPLREADTDIFDILVEEIGDGFKAGSNLRLFGYKSG